MSAHAEPATPVITPDALVSLRPVTPDNLRAVMRLKVRPEQEQFVAPNPVSLAQGAYEPLAWLRAIYADETPVGFVMLHDDPFKPEYYLWRLMIDAHYQRMGFARQGMTQVIEYVSVSYTHLDVYKRQGSDQAPLPAA